MTYGYTRGANRLAILILSSLFTGGTALLTGCGTTPVASSSSGSTTPAPPPSTPAPPPPAGSSSAAATPSFSPGPGVYTSAQTVSISDSTPGAAIYYTTDGTTPSTSSTQYTQPITVGSTATIKAISTATGYSSSAAASATYTINISAAGGGTSLPTKIVTIADAVPGVTIYYTTDGTTPTTSSAQYTGPITINSTSTIKAIAVANGYTNSAVGAITVSDPGSSQAATPTLSPSAGIYSAAQTIAISASTAGAVIYYTTDGTTPTTNSTQYSGAIQVSSSATINAIAVATGYANSATASATYTIGSAAKSP